MSYVESMEAAGAVVHDSEYFGSYQGDLIAHVTYEGKTGFVMTSYGSCSGCDWYEAEMGWDLSDYCRDPHYRHESSCQACVASKAQYDEALRKFGENLLEADQVMDADTAISKISDFDWERAQMIAWIEARR